MVEGILLNGFIFLYEKRELECGIGKWQRFGKDHSGTNRITGQWRGLG